MNSNSECLDQQLLSAWMQGALSGPEALMIASHVETCDACECTLAAMELDAPLGWLQTARGGSADLSPILDDSDKSLIERLAKARPGNNDVKSNPPMSYWPEKIRDYRLIAPLGHGGMGSVYKAMHERLGREVAIKLLTISPSYKSQSIERFLLEMQAVGRLEHPNIVHAMDAGEYDGVYFLSMELIAGADLSLISEAAGPVPTADACEIIMQTAIGLQFAHENGLIHRDVKPANLMLTLDPSGQPLVKILDLGLARLESEELTPALTGYGQLMGTLEFMAPEQAEDVHSADARADVYSLGATAYQLLSGMEPFSGCGTNLVERIKLLTESSPPKIASKCPDLPIQLAALIDRMVSRAPEDRPKTMVEVVSAIAPFAIGNQLPALLARVVDEKRSEIAKLPTTLRGESTTDPSEISCRNQPTVVCDKPDRKPYFVPDSKVMRKPDQRLIKLGTMAALTILAIGVTWYQFYGQHLRIEAITPVRRLPIVAHGESVPESSSAQLESNDLVPEPIVAARRTLAEYVLQLGGHVDSGNSTIRSFEHLPRQPGVLTHIAIPDAESDLEIRELARQMHSVPECTSLHIGGGTEDRITNKCLSHVGQLTHMHRLQLSSARITDAGISSLSGIPNLQFLGLDGCRIQGDCLTLLPKLFPRLTTLNLNNVPVAPTALSVLREMSTLERLDLNIPELPDEAFVHLTELPLAALTVREMPQFSQLSATTIAALPDLRELSIYNCALTDEHLAQFVTIPKLSALHLNSVHVTTPGLETLARARPELRIWVDENLAQELQASGFSQFQSNGFELHMPQREVAEYVTMRGGSVDVIDLDFERTLTGLHHPEELPAGPIAITALEIRGRTDLDLWHLCELLLRTPRLRKVRIYDSPRVTDRGLRTLDKLTQITDLDLSLSGLTPNSLRTICRMDNLRWLRLNVTLLGDSGLEHVAALTQLESLDLTGDMTPIGLSRLPPTLKILHVRSPRINDSFWSHLTTLTSLEELSIRGSLRVNGTGIAAIKDCPTLHTLDLSGTAVSDDAVAELISSPSLRNLNLNETRVSDVCLASLERCTLTSLRITGTTVTNEGLEHLKIVLPECEILVGNP